MAKLRVLCLHGSCQSSEIFSQRIKVLTRKLQDVAVSHLKWACAVDAAFGRGIDVMQPLCTAYVISHDICYQPNAR